MERDLHRALVKKRSTLLEDLDVPVVITSGQNEIGDDNGDSTANKTVQTISNITRNTASSAFQAYGNNQVGTSSGTHTGTYMSPPLGLNRRNLDEIPVNTTDGMVPRSQISYPRGNVGSPISYLGQARSISLPTTHEHFLNGSGGGMASAFPLNNTFAGYMQSQAANIMGSVMSPTNTQGQHIGGSVPPGRWCGFQSRILQSPANNTGNNYVPDRTGVYRSPSPLLAGKYSVMGGNVPIGLSNTNARQNAFQLAGSLNDPRWRGYNAMASFNQSLSYQNQFTGGGFLRASPGNNAAPRTWFHMGGHNYQTMVPQLDASFLGTRSAGNGTGGSRSLNYSPRVDNVHSDVIILNDGGQSEEQTATYDLNGIMEGAVKGAYEFDYWITHGRPPSSSRASSSVPPLPAGSSLAPQSQGGLNYSPNVHSDVTVLNDVGGQSTEQTATYDLNSIMEGAVKGAYEYEYWITHGRPPSSTRASSSVPPLPSGSSLAPQSQGESTEQVVSMENDPLPAEPSPGFQFKISDKQVGKAIVSPSNEAAGSPSFQNQSGI